MQFSSTSQDHFTLNPQRLCVTSRSRFMKSPQRIGKIISKNLQINLHVLGQSSNFDQQRLLSQQNYKEENKINTRSPLLPNRSLYLQNYQNKIPQNKLLQQPQTQDLSPSVNKNFRINKIKSSQISTKSARKQKTPENIGKLSSSKINILEVNQSLDLDNSNIYQKDQRKSPGKIVSRKQMIWSNKNKQQKLQNKLLFVEEKPQQYLDINNQNLLSQVKQKQQYLKQLIQKHKTDTKYNQAFLPKKNIKSSNYNYPVTSKQTAFRQKSPYYQNNHKKPYTPYLQKIQDNSKGFKSFISAPKYTQYQRNKSLLFQKSKANQTTKPSRKIIGEQSILQKSRALQMRINPQINISFTVKSPRTKNEYCYKVEHRQIDQQEVFKRSTIKQAQHQLAPRISQYSPEKNKKMNNRKAKFIDALIDPLPQEYKAQQQLAVDKIQLSKYADHFSRIKFNNERHENHLNSQNISQLNDFTSCSSPQPITLRTKISTIKQILIQSSDRLNLHISLPSCLFISQKIHSNTQVQQLHWMMQKVFSQMQLRPEIVTIKQYKNAVFMGMHKANLEAKQDEFDRDKQIQKYVSIIYHLNGKAIYVGDWFQNKNNQSTQIKEISTNRQQESVISGYKQGIGLQITCRRISQNSQKSDNQIENCDIMIQIYYGQFQNSLKKGYGLLQQYLFKRQKLDFQRLEIGCWKDNKKHGWVKTFINCQLSQNAQYDHDVLTKKRNIKQVITS